VAVARRDFVEAHPAAVAAFLADYADSVAWVNANTADAAALIGDYDIVDAAVAELALPYCNIVCITGGEMKEKLSGYLSVLFDAEPDAVGGALPGDDFYYGA
jgi:NitT/TauT family transport system substrate-binding protein